MGWRSVWTARRRLAGDGAAAPQSCLLILRWQGFQASCPRGHQARSLGRVKTWLGWASACSKPSVKELTPSFQAISQRKVRAHCCFPSPALTGQRLSFGLFQADVKQLNDLPPGFAVPQESAVQKTPPLHLQNCFVSAPNLPAATGSARCICCCVPTGNIHPQHCTFLLWASPNGAVVNASHKAIEAELPTSTERLRAEKKNQI